MEKPLAKYKVIFLGDAKVGKTSILTRFMYQKFDYAYQPTIGVDWLSKTMCLEDNTVRLQLWDACGQERFRHLIPSYIKDSPVAVIVYDVTNRHSFLKTSMWIEMVRTQHGSNAIIVLVENKIDHVDKREVSYEEGYATAHEHGAMFVETSAKSGFNTKALFVKIATELPPGVIVPPPDHAAKPEKPEAREPVNKQTASSDTFSSIPTSFSFTCSLSKPDMTIEELQKLGPWMVESMTLMARALHTPLPPFHYGQTSSHIPTNSGTHVCGSEPDATNWRSFLLGLNIRPIVRIFRGLCGAFLLLIVFNCFVILL